MNESEFHNLDLGAFQVGRNQPLALIAGCCAIESRERTMMICERLVEITASLEMPFVFKASYDKANRNSIGSYRGPGMKEGLEILAQVKRAFGVPILADVHETGQVADAAAVADILQIPAFLCRQTDLTLAVAQSGKAVNVKKGQFLAPQDVRNIIGKIESTGCRRILLTERGVSFGYHQLVVDMAALPIMRATGYPVVFDATHAVQTPAGQGGSSGGARAMIPFLARAACAAGVDALFMEVHDDPEHALCDGPNSLPLGVVRDLLRSCQDIDRLVAEEMREILQF
ncbi:MAG: 3-deoxy-8-phosphooctulonate synthase [Candidatus Sumerlaeota bacterium]|nr:3-deoxy-8-phosphooctulonate synthase [Candidatus Sumerlaeota bacterium]